MLLLRQKLELDTTLFCRNTIRLLSVKVPRAPLLSSDMHSSAEEPVVAAGFYLITEYEGLTRKRGRSLPERRSSSVSPALLTPSSLSWLLCLHFSISCVSLSPLRLNHLLSGRGLKGRQDAFATAWLPHFKTDLSARASQHLSYFLTALLHLHLHPVCFSLSQKKNPCFSLQLWGESECLSDHTRLFPNISTVCGYFESQHRQKQKEVIVAQVIVVCKKRCVLLEMIT